MLLARRARRSGVCGLRGEILQEAMIRRRHLSKDLPQVRIEALDLFDPLRREGIRAENVCRLNVVAEKLERTLEDLVEDPLGLLRAVQLLIGAREQTVAEVAVISATAMTRTSGPRNRPRKRRMSSVSADFGAGAFLVSARPAYPVWGTTRRCALA
jgi:hypothetical protein